MAHGKLGPATIFKSIDGGNKDDDGKSEVCPFDQAESDAQLDAALEVTDAIDKASAATDDEVATPKQVRPKKVKYKNKDSSKGLGIAALSFALLACAGTGYSLVSNHSFKITAQEDLKAMNWTVGNLTEQSGSMVADISSNKKAIDANQEKLADVDSMRSDFDALQDSFIALEADTISLSDVDVEFNGELMEQQKQLNELKVSFEKLQKKRTYAAKKQATKKAAPKVVQDTTKLEGATLASLDMWGTQPYAVLRSADGKWIPLTRGDLYHGWRFNGGVGDEGLFQKGGKQRRIKVEG